MAKKADKHFDAQTRRRRTKRAIILLVAMVVLAIVGYLGYLEFQKSTQPVIKNAPGVTKPYAVPNSETQRFDTPLFGFELPVDWKLIKHEVAPYDLYSYRGTLPNADNRYMDIYVDKLPLTMAVNKVVRVTPQGNNLSHGLASENCVDLMKIPRRTPTAPQPLAVPAKWDGADFLCDNDNITANLIGSSSPGNINKVTLIGPTTGTHHFFFTYYDKNNTPDYSILYNMLESFTVK